MTTCSRITAILCAAMMLFSVAACSSQSSAPDSAASGSPQTASSSSADSSAETTTNTIEGSRPMTAYSVKLLGRTYASPDGSLWMGLSGTGAELEYTGSKLSVTLKGYKTSSDKAARVGIYVNGQLQNDLLTSEKEQTIDIQGKGSTPVNVKIIKLSECTSSCCAITAVDTHGGEIKKAADGQHRIEFIGDSITCGYGVDDQDLTHGFSTATEDCTKSYAFKTAQALKADYSLVSYSGYGIVSGYSENGVKRSDLTVPQYYESYGFTETGGFGTQNPSKIKWDFSSFVPEVIVVYLGTNDSSYTNMQEEKVNEYTECYVDFLKQIRSKNAGAKIICTLGTMGYDLNGAMVKAAEQYTEQTGDKNITTLDLPLQDIVLDGVAVNGHPTEKTYDKAASVLCEKIKSEMGW